MECRVAKERSFYIIYMYIYFLWFSPSGSSSLMLEQREGSRPPTGIGGV